MPRFRAWLPRFPARHFSRQAAGDRLLLVALIAGSGLLVWFAWDLPLAWQALGWGLVLTGLAALLRRGWVQFFGPVFFYDLVRTARKGQQIGHRCVYAVVLVAMIFVVYWSWLPGVGSDFSLLLTEAPHVSAAKRAQFASTFSIAFMVIQFLVVLIVTPAYTAGAIAEEKDRRTLEFLLATDLSDREIVLGMMAARLGNLFLLVLTGLPVLSLFEFLGGVDPELVLAGFVATGMTVLSLGGVSILMSVLSKTPLSALVRSYLWGFGYLCILLFCGPATLTVYFAASLASTAGGGTAMTFFYASVLLIYSGVHAFITLVCCRQAIFHLRVQALGTTGRPRVIAPPGSVARKPSRPAPAPARPSRPAPTQQSAAEVIDSWGPYSEWPVIEPVDDTGTLDGISQPRPLPPVTDNPLLWKELYTDQYFGLPRKENVTPIVAVLGLILLAVAMMSLTIHIKTDYGLSTPFNALVRTWGTLVSCAMALIVGLSAARRITRERQRQTLDSLLTVPQERAEILFAKWLASVLSIRGLWWVAVGIWGIGLVTGGLHPFALPLVLAASVVYVTFMASLGLWFSAMNHTSMRATLFTLLAGLVILILPGFMAGVTGAGSNGVTSPGDPVDWADLFMGYGINPAGALWVLAFRAEDFDKGKEMLSTAKVFVVVAGLHVYMLTSVLLWLLTCARLRAQKGPASKGLWKSLDGAEGARS